MNDVLSLNACLSGNYAAAVTAFLLSAKPGDGPQDPASRLYAAGPQQQLAARPDRRQGRLRPG